MSNIYYSKEYNATFELDAGGNITKKICNGQLAESSKIFGARIIQLEQRCAKLEEMVLAMWDAPGMPGAAAVLEEFEKINGNL